MNLPSKIKIIKAHDGLPPVGTVMIKSEIYKNLYFMDGDDYRFKTLMNVTVSLALEAKYAEPVVEQWQAWEREEGKIYFRLDASLNVGSYMESFDYIDDEHFKSGNYFLNRELAEQARDRILETLKQFHKEHKTQ